MQPREDTNVREVSETHSTRRALGLSMIGMLVILSMVVVSGRFVAEDSVPLRRDIASEDTTDEGVARRAASATDHATLAAANLRRSERDVADQSVSNVAPVRLGLDTFAPVRLFLEFEGAVQSEHATLRIDPSAVGPHLRVRLTGWIPEGDTARLECLPSVATTTRTNEPTDLAVSAYTHVRTAVRNEHDVEGGRLLLMESEASFVVLPDSRTRAARVRIEWAGEEVRFDLELVRRIDAVTVDVDPSTGMIVVNATLDGLFTTVPRVLSWNDSGMTNQLVLDVVAMPHRVVDPDEQDDDSATERRIGLHGGIVLQGEVHSPIDPRTLRFGETATRAESVECDLVPNDVPQER